MPDFSRLSPLSADLAHAAAEARGQDRRDLTIAAFVSTRLDEWEVWAIEASRRKGGEAVPGGAHWRWEDTATDDAVTPDPETFEFVDEGREGAISLRSRETWPTPSGVGDLPQVAISQAEQVPAAVGGHIIRHDPASVLRQVGAIRQILADWDEHRVLDQISGLNHFIEEKTLCKTIRWLATMWADHPEYLEEWAP